MVSFLSGPAADLGKRLHCWLDIYHWKVRTIGSHMSLYELEKGSLEFQPCGTKMDSVSSATSLGIKSSCTVNDGSLFTQFHLKQGCVIGRFTEQSSQILRRRILDSHASTKSCFPASYVDSITEHVITNH